eukprot:11082200-Lingulodinium_polyedra.AAC.1
MLQTPCSQLCVRTYSTARQRLASHDCFQQDCCTQGTIVNHGGPQKQHVCPTLLALVGSSFGSENIAQPSAVCL